MQSMFSDSSGVKLEINNQKNKRKYPNNSLLKNNSQDKLENTLNCRKMKIQQYQAVKSSLVESL